MGIEVDFASALLLSIIAAIAAAGASGVAGGSLLLIPMAASLFGIDNATAMQVVSIGFIIGVVQDSAETALNSSTDVLVHRRRLLQAGRSVSAQAADGSGARARRSVSIAPS